MIFFSSAVISSPFFEHLDLGGSTLPLALAMIALDGSDGLFYSLLSSPSRCALFCSGNIFVMMGLVF